MDAKIAFWAAALLNMGAVVFFALRGVRAIRDNDISRHRRSMLTAGALVGAFLVAYVVKVATLGSEDLGTWSQAHRVNLWVHESFVVGMLLAGLGAAVVARRFASSRRVTGDPEDPAADAADLRRHRLAGRIAIGASVLGFVTACGILVGMLARA